MHAVDDYFASAGGRKDMLSSSPEVRRASLGLSVKDIPGVRHEMVMAFGDIKKAIENGEMLKRSKHLDTRRSKPYWSLATELQSRAFEAYIADKLAEKGMSNDYLVNIVSEEYWQTQNILLDKGGQDDFPYPKVGEMTVINEAFDNFFKTVKLRETDKGVEMYSLGKRAQEKLDSDSAEFGKQVDQFIQKKVTPHQELIVMQTPLVLQISDERVRALPIVISQRTLSKIFRKHNLSPALVKQMPKAIADPIMVLQSEGKQGQVKDGLVIMLDLKDRKGNTINVPLALNMEHSGPDGKYECNDIASVYGRESSITGLPYDQWFVDQAKKPGVLKYINTEKFSRWINQTRLVVPEGKSNGRTGNNISANNKNVNGEGVNGIARRIDETGAAIVH